MQEQKASNPALGHLRANLWLLVLSVVICCVLYPAAVWVVGQIPFFHNQAEGSLIDANGQPTTDPAKAVGSTQIAQPFNSYFFQSRPSATSPSAYNGAASSGSNLAASNPKLRGRVAQLLGTISRYSDDYKNAHKKSEGGAPSPQEDILAWYKEQPAERRWSDWAANYSSMAQGWATGTTSIQDYIQEWEDKHPGVAEDWKKDNAQKTQPPAFSDLLPYFFNSYEKEFSGKWPASESISAWGKDHSAVVTRWKAANAGKGEPTDADLAGFFPDDSAKNPGDWPSAKAGEWLDAAQKAVVQPVALQESDIQSTYFDMWLTEQVQAKKLDPQKDFVQVPADMVMASGSGLDPDISLENAQYQEDNVVPAYAGRLADDFLKGDAYKNLSDKEKQAKHDEWTEKLTPKVKEKVDALLKTLPYRPMFGLTGETQLVNVLELNLRLQAKEADWEKAPPTK